MQLVKLEYKNASWRHMQMRVCSRQYVSRTIYDGQFIEMAGLVSSLAIAQTFLDLSRHISADIYSCVHVCSVYESKEYDFSRSTT